MTITLRPITRDNLWAVVNLKLHPHQEQLIEDNVASIANAYVELTFVPLAVYAGDELVGFAMYGQHAKTGDWVGDPDYDRLGPSGRGPRPGGDGGAD
jgi:diamine N-acetyltransferase